jgi:antitoxin ChpS
MHTTNLRKVGGSVMMALPPALLDVLQLKVGASVGIAVADGRLVIDPLPKPQYTLEALLAESDFTQDQTSQERVWVDAPPVGRELI